MATPKNHIEIILIDRGFSGINEKCLKKIFIPITIRKHSSESSVCLDMETQESLVLQRQKLYDVILTSEKNLLDDEESSLSSKEGGKCVRQSYFGCLRNIYNSFWVRQGVFNASPCEKNGPLYLMVDSLPNSIREIIFDDCKFNIENWDSLNEAIMWLSWLRTLNISFQHRESMQMAEYIKILKEIQNSCLTREAVMKALYLS